VPASTLSVRLQALPSPLILATSDKVKRMFRDVRSRCTSRNVGKVCRSQSWYHRTLFSLFSVHLRTMSCMCEWKVASCMYHAVVTCTSDIPETKL